MCSWKERKLKRTENYFKNIYKIKLIICPCCNGSGYYDNTGNPKCSYCKGTGKIKENKY